MDITEQVNLIVDYHILYFALPGYKEYLQLPNGAKIYPEETPVNGISMTLNRITECVCDVIIYPFKREHIGIHYFFIENILPNGTKSKENCTFSLITKIHQDRIIGAALRIFDEQYTAQFTAGQVYQLALFDLSTNKPSSMAYAEFRAEVPKLYNETCDYDRVPLSKMDEECGIIAANPDGEMIHLIFKAIKPCRFLAGFRVKSEDDIFNETSSLHVIIKEIISENDFAKPTVHP